VASDLDGLPRVVRRTVLYVVSVVLAVLAAAWSLSRLTDFWVTLAFAFFLGLVMEPTVNRLERRGWRRGAGTAFVLLALIGGVTAFVLVFGNALVTQLSALVADIPRMVTSAVDWINAQTGADVSAESVLARLGITSTDLAEAVAALGVGLVEVVASAVGLLFSGAMMLFFAFYIAADGPQLRRTIAAWFPPRRQQVILTVWDISTARAGSYVISRGILALISAAAHAVFFSLVGLPYFLPLGLWVGFVSQFIPTIGTYLAGLLPIVVALAIGEPAMALAILVFVTIYQQVENLILSPRVTQETMQIHAAVAFGAVVVGGTLFGAPGALLAIPIIAIVQAVVDTYGRRYALVPELEAMETEASPAAESERTGSTGWWRTLPLRHKAVRHHDHGVPGGSRAGDGRHGPAGTSD
jgi:predicted PurR-regulated permease PerM